MVRMTAAVAAVLAMTGLRVLAQQAQPVRPLDLGNGIYEAIGVAGGTAGSTTVRVPQSNTFMVVTPGGNVIIDTSGAGAPAHKQQLTTISSAPAKAIVLTHAHGDHTGGVGVWKGPDTEIIAQRNHQEFMRYQQRLAGFFALRNGAQFGLAPLASPLSSPLVSSRAVTAAAGRVPPFEPTNTFDDKYTFAVGGVTFELLHTPGETPDHLTVWLPHARAAFIGDNYYLSFPNLYTLRGTEPRWALDYVQSLDTVLRLEPELVLPSHGPPIRGRDEIKRQLTQYRDAILYVHDATVKGMNEGKDVFTLMREIRLPSALDIGESYGKLSWSVRGIYEGYAGWFDGNPSTMFGTPSLAYPEMVKLAGGPDAVAARARVVAASDPLGGLYLTDMALAADPKHRGTLEVRIAILKTLDQQSTNSNERGWLQAGIRAAEARL